MRITDSLSLVASLQFGLSGPLDCAVYAVRGPDGVVLIDSGAGTHTGTILENVAADVNAAPVRAVVLTHSHADHAGGAADVRLATGCRVICPEMTKRVLESGDERASGLESARKAGVYPAEYRLQSCAVDDVLQDGRSFEAAGVIFRPIQVSGHSPDSFCLLATIEGRVCLFSGDTLFYGGVLGVINAEGSEMAGYRRDLRKLDQLEVEALFPGHGIFTLRGAQRHISCALQQLAQGFVPRQIGQGDLIF